MRSRLLTCFEEKKKKVAGFLSVLYLYLGDLIPKHRLLSAKLSLQGFSNDNTLLLIHGFSF